jgi:parvulin-like peptidyl-prolyl isomerase
LTLRNALPSVARVKWFRILALAGLSWGCVLAQPNVRNGVAAVVNKSIITLDEVQGFSVRALQTAARRARTQEAFEAEGQRITKDGLEQLIERRLIIDEFAGSGYNLPEALINDIVQDRIKREFGDRLTLMKDLRARNQNYESFRTDEKEAFIVAQMILKNINQQLVISPKKIERYYAEHPDKFHVNDRVKVRMIQLVPGVRSVEENRELARDVGARLKAGEDFAKLADQFSSDARRFKGGDRGWVEDKDSDLRKELREVAFKLAPGQVSDAVDLGGAIFFLKTEEKQAAHLKPLNEARDEIEGELMTMERNRLRQGWVTRLRRKAFVRYY